MGVREQMIGILRSDETRRIRFSFTGTGGSTVSVNFTSFQRVAEGLEHNDLHVVEDHFTTDIAMYSAHAEDGTAANTFYLGNNPRWSRSFNGLIVHEAVHASFDLTRSQIPWVDNEAAGYIAQAYYLRNSGVGLERMELGTHARIGYNLILDMRAGGDIGFLLDALRNSLDGDPQYHRYIRTQFTGDG